jgi:tetratricopeptide (TPR) repeat protein
MNTEELIAYGNQCREENNPEQALAYYAQAFVQDRQSASAFNNYGNVLREVGDPVGAIPFLERAISLAPTSSVAHFNLAVSLLLSGNYQRGWSQYESRWNFEHLDGTLPKYTQPRWVGQDLKDKTILVCQEQGLGDTIQFSRFLFSLHASGAKIILQANNNLAPLFANSSVISNIVDPSVTPENFDYWVPIMSLPTVLGITLENLPPQIQYLSARTDLTKNWQTQLGLKNKLRVGFCWSGRPDSWINRHKGMPFETMCELIKRNPNYEWINLQIECTADESAILHELGVKMYPGAIRSFADTAALIHHLDVVLSVDTAIAHLAGALGRPTWVMLNNYAVDWRWLLDRDSSPWYPSARLFRQPKMGDWASVVDKIHQYLSWFKI